MNKLKKTPPIHDTLTGYDFRVDEPLGRKAAVRAKCLECQCQNAAEVRKCEIFDCPLYPWRMGTLLAAKKVDNRPVNDTSDDFK